jgi:hypothetical protein
MRLDREVSFRLIAAGGDDLRLVTTAKIDGGARLVLIEAGFT